MESEGHDFSGLTDFELIEMQKEVRPFVEISEGDKRFLRAILVELGRRHKAHLEEDKRKREGDHVEGEEGLGESGRGDH